MAKPIPCSVLDLAVIKAGGTPEQAIADVVRTASTADEAGYRRFWVAEHHGSPRSAGSSPAVLMAHIAANTRRIRVGSGGVMLTNHAPFVIAEQFAILTALHGDRIDLGVGRASGGTDMATVLDRALQRDPRRRAEFPSLVDDLLGFVHDDWPADHPFAALTVSPRSRFRPAVHVLGTSENGARVAAERGLPFVYGFHLGKRVCRPAALDRYRENFRPSQYGDRPSVIASLSVLCAEDDDTAQRLAFEVAVEDVRHHNRGRPALSPVRERHLAAKTIDEAQVLHGSPDTVAAGIDRLADELGAAEIMLVPYDLTGAGRARTLRLAATSRAPMLTAVPA